MPLTEELTSHICQLNELRKCIVALNSNSFSLADSHIFFLAKRRQVETSEQRKCISENCTRWLMRLFTDRSLSGATVDIRLSSSALNHYWNVDDDKAEQWWDVFGVWRLRIDSSAILEKWSHWAFLPFDLVKFRYFQLFEMTNSSNRLPNDDLFRI